MKCPNCNETLIMSDRNGVEIDYCPTCRGVWLDRGELDKIIERSVLPSQDIKYSRGSNHHHGNDYGKNDEYYKKKRKDSFLGDLFDF